MDWIKVKVKHALAEYSDLTSVEYAAWIKIMALTAFLEAIPSEKQILQIIHKSTSNSLQTKLKSHSNSLQTILKKVLEDVDYASNLKKQNCSKVKKWRELHKKKVLDVTSNVTVTVPVTLPHKRREEKRREEYIHAPSIGEEKTDDAFDVLEAFNLLLAEYPIKIGESRARETFFQWQVTNDMVSRIFVSIKKYKLHLSANDWKTAMNFNSFLETWTDWENHEEVKTEKQKLEELKKSLKERV